MHHSYSPLRVEILPSPTLVMFIHSLHGAVFIFCLFLPLPIGVIGVSLLMVITSWVVAARRYIVCVGDAGITTVEWQCDSGWSLLEGDSQAQQVELLEGTFVSTWMIILRFRLGRFRERYLILLSDNTDADEVRRLRIRLRNYPGEALNKS
ncbi:MAG: protein YgfX [Candidatus Sedimenticola sp. (ex Thyasira tokunagai)]